MMNKLTKTIFLIVFVVFLGMFKISTVRADVAMGCYYRGDDYVLAVNVSDTFRGEIIYLYNLGEKSVESNRRIRNWDKIDDDVPVFVPTANTQNLEVGYGYYYTGYRDVWHHENCPERAIIVEYNEDTSGGFWNSLGSVSGRKYIYFSTAEKTEEWISYIRRYPVNGAASSKSERILELAASTSTSTLNRRPVNQKKCKCDNNDTFMITRGLPQQRISGNYVENWYNYAYSNNKMGNSTYTALSDIGRANTCPKHLIVTTGTRMSLLSDDANLDIILSDLRDPAINNISDSNINVYDCRVDTSSPLTDPTFTKPPYENPGMNPNIVKPLDPDGATLTCGGGFMNGIHSTLPRVSSLIFIFLQVIAPIILVIFGTMDFMKAVTSQKEDEIKKGQQTFIQRLITAAILFFVFAILKFVVSIFSDNTNGIVDCMNCFLRGPSQCERE